MNKTFHVAVREFAATVLTKSFLIGVLVVPFIVTAMIPLALLLISDKPPKVDGTVGIIDRSGGDKGLALDRIVENLSPEGLAAMYAERHKEEIKEAKKVLPEEVGKQAELASSIGAAAMELPKITAEPLAPGADVEAEKQKLLHDSPYDGGRLALVVVDDNAVRAKGGAKDYGAYDFFIHAKLDMRVQADIRRQVTRAIIRSRIEKNGQDPERILAMTRLESPEAVSVTTAGEKSSSEMQQMFVPLAFMMLLWISVFTGGQFLMTSTIEEKSSRVMEVLLSAVSPMELMTGKILGQMAAGLLILIIYSGMGIGALLAFSRSDLISYTNLFFLVIFFFIAFFFIAAMMASVGSAVTDIHEAQTLLTPVMLVVMIPMLLMMPIIMHPNGTMATVLSFVPPLNPFVMVLRICSSDPPPMWQTLVSIAVGVVGVYIALRMAAKIFRIGVLMYGKPPNLATLIRWVRMA